MSRVGIEGTFIEGRRGRIFVLVRRPQGASGRAVLIVPPFAEEMNKSRAMFADVGRELAARGIAAVLPDLFGTGDSEGEFRDADWETWKDDLARTVLWAGGAGLRVDALLCVRLGCVLGVEAARDRFGDLRRVVFWQPVLEGRGFITQFLRLRVAASMMGDQKETVTSLRHRLGAGDVLEVAGYELGPRLVERIEQTRLVDALDTRLRELHWIEVVRSADASIPGATAQATEEAGRRLPSVKVETVVGEPFWSSTEIVRLPELVSRTVTALAAA